MKWHHFLKKRAKPVMDLGRGIAQYPHFLKNAAQTWKLFGTAPPDTITTDLSIMCNTEMVNPVLFQRPPFWKEGAGWAPILKF